MRLHVRLASAAILLASCTSAPPSEPPAPLHVPGGTPILRLTAADAAWVLPQGGAEPAEDEVQSELTRFVRATGRTARQLDLRLQAELPFEPGPGADAVPPPGMRVLVDGEVLPYTRRPGDQGTWRIVDDSIQFSAERPPTRVVVEHPSLRARVERLSPARSGLAPADYAPLAWTIGQEPRQGLLLPAGAEASWTVAVPAGARLEAAVAMVEDGLRRTESDRELIVEVVDGGGPAEVARARVPATSSSWEPLRADLSRWAGRTVTLRVRSEGDVAGDVPLLAHPTVVGAKAGQEPRRIVWIGLDTTRRDRLGLYGYDRPTTPNLDAWARDATVFDDAVPPAPRTRPSFRSAVTGRRPLDAVGSEVILDRLDDAGFRTAGIVANVHLNQRFGFTAGAERWLLDPAARADQQVDRALSWLQEHQDQDAALFLHIMDPHLPYLPPAPQKEAFVRDPSPLIGEGRFVRSQVYRWLRADKLDDQAKQHISDLYDAEVAFTDQELGRLFAGLDALPGRTLVVVHSDHGEELFDHGAFEHNHTLKPELHDAVMLIREPGQQDGRRVDDPVELADLVPTVLDLLGLPGDGLDGRSLRPALQGEDLPPISRDLGHLMYDRERWAVRSGDHTYVLWTGSGREALFDRSTDPTESHDLIDGADPDLLARLRSELAQVHGAVVGPGWRVHLHLGPEPVTVELPSPAEDVLVLDPKRDTPHRANQAWGERPRVLPEDIATVELGDDRRAVTITPGGHGEGTILVRFAAPTPVAGAVRSGSDTTPLQPDIPLAVPGVHAFRVVPGTLILPPPDEATRMKALMGDLEDVDAATTGILFRLGYLRGGEEEREEDEE